MAADSVRGKRRSSRRKPGSRRKSQGGGRIARSRAYKHERDLERVMWTVQRELIRDGFFPGPGKLGWTWRDAIPPPAPAGMVNALYFFGRSATLLEAGMLVQEAYDWQTGLLAELLSLVKQGSGSPGLQTWLDENRTAVLTLLQNAKISEQNGMAFGGGDFTGVAGKAEAAVTALALKPEPESITALTQALQAMRPRARDVGFYAPGGSGPVSHFATILRERGWDYETIATLLGDLKAQEAFVTKDRWKEHRKAAIDTLKHRVNGRKAVLRRRFGSDSVLGNVAQNFPRHDRWAVLFSTRVEAHSTATVTL